MNKNEIRQVASVLLKKGEEKYKYREDIEKMLNYLFTRKDFSEETVYYIFLISMLYENIFGATTTYLLSKVCSSKRGFLKLKSVVFLFFASDLFYRIGYIVNKGLTFCVSYLKTVYVLYRNNMIDEKKYYRFLSEILPYVGELIFHVIKFEDIDVNKLLSNASKKSRVLFILLKYKKETIFNLLDKKIKKKMFRDFISSSFSMYTRDYIIKYGPTLKVSKDLSLIDFISLDNIYYNPEILFVLDIENSAVTNKLKQRLGMLLLSESSLNKRCCDKRNLFVSLVIEVVTNNLVLENYKLPNGIVIKKMYPTYWYGVFDSLTVEIERNEDVYKKNSKIENIEKFSFYNGKGFSLYVLRS